MQVIICQEPGRINIAASKRPVPVAGEALLKIKRVGICGTDLHAYKGNQPYFSYPRILGHELAAEVVGINDEQGGIRAGDQVVVLPYRHCGECFACRTGKTNCCSNIKVFGVHMDGGMQEYIAYPASLLLPAPGLTLDEIAIVEPLSIGAHALRRARISSGEYAVVVGCGPIGLGLLRLLQIAGARVIALDINPARLRYCQEVFKVENTILASNEPVQQVLEITGGDLAPVVFDATGHKQALEEGIQYMAHGGRYVLVGLSKGELSFRHPDIHAKESAILCSRNATGADFMRVIGLLQDKKFPADAYITHRLPFDQIPKQFDSWLNPENEVIKVMTEWGK